MEWNSDWDDDSFLSYLAGSVHEAWERCLLVWAELGRVNDFPPGMRRVRYNPSFGTSLGRRFVEVFVDESLFLLDRYQFGSEFESRCAFDLLTFLAEDLYTQDRTLPDILKRCGLPLPEHIREEVASDWIYRDHNLDTIGKLLSFENNGQEPVARVLIKPSSATTPVSNPAP